MSLLLPRATYPSSSCCQSVSTQAHHFETRLHRDKTFLSPRARAHALDGNSEKSLLKLGLLVRRRMNNRKMAEKRKETCEKNRSFQWLASASRLEAENRPEGSGENQRRLECYGTRSAHWNTVASGGSWA